MATLDWDAVNCLCGYQGDPLPYIGCPVHGLNRDEKRFMSCAKRDYGNGAHDWCTQSANSNGVADLKPGEWVCMNCGVIRGDLYDGTMEAIDKAVRVMRG